MRPFGQAGPAMGGGFGQPQQPQMGGGGFGQPQQQQGAMMGQQGVAGAPTSGAPFGGPNANGQGFSGHLQASTNTMGNYEEYMVKSIACDAKDFGQATQNFCSEMLRWDDYRTVKQINDGTAPLKATFDTNKPGMMQFGLPFLGHREMVVKNPNEKVNNLYKVFVCHPKINSAPTQNFSSEMERWDHMRTEKQINDGTPNMRQTFSDTQMLTCTNTDASQAKPTSSTAAGGATSSASGFNNAGQFVGYQTETVSSSNVRSYNRYNVISCKPIYEGKAAHNFCSEMLRWDDYRTVKQINDGLGPLQPMFDVPPAPQQAPASGGFGQQAPASGGGFGQQAPASGGFGQPQQAPGGFGQQAPASGGGFGQQAPASGGFGQQAPASGGFGQPQQAPGGFGQQAPASGGFGQQAPASGGFGAAVGGGFGRRM